MNDRNDEPEKNAPAEAPETQEKAAEKDDAMSPMRLAGEVYDWVEIFVITITAVFLIFTFIARIAYVDGPSMNNTLHDRDTLIVSRLFYTAISSSFSLRTAVSKAVSSSASLRPRGRPSTSTLTAGRLRSTALSSTRTM